MLKFVGKNKDFIAFIAKILVNYGANATLKEVIEKEIGKC